MSAKTDGMSVTESNVHYDVEENHSSLPVAGTILLGKGGFLFVFL